MIENNSQQCFKFPATSDAYAANVAASARDSAVNEPGQATNDHLLRLNLTLLYFSALA